MSRRNGFRAAVAGWMLLGALAAACAAASPAAPWLEAMPQARVTIDDGQVQHVFDAWIAATPASRTRGLMFVRELDPASGMLFLFDRPEYASFWMRNTYVSLDLLFIDEAGRIVNIIERAAPLSTTPLQSAAPVTAVLELLGGTAGRLGIRPGNRVRTAAIRDDG